MDDTEARVRCIEVAASLCRATNNYDPKHVVDSASALYTFVNQVPVAKPPVQKADKPSPKK